MLAAYHADFREETSSAPAVALWKKKKIIFSSHLQNFSKSILQKPLSVPHSAQLVKEGRKKRDGNTKKKKNKIKKSQ